jgi:alkylhydroperoxidase family enzyme
VGITRSPAKASRGKIEALRSAGNSDEQIHDAVQVIALFNYFTRMAHALGVELEDSMPRR